MVPFKQVTVLVSPVVQPSLPDNTRGNPTLTTGWSVTGYLEHMTPGEAYADYGVNLQSPAIMQIEVSDWLAAAAAAGQTPSAFAITNADAQISVTGALHGGGSFIGNIYGVRGRPTCYDEGLPADHVVFVLDQKMHGL